MPHTPGPWHWATHPLGCDYPYYSTLYAGPPDDLLTVCNVSGFGGTVRVSEADARLIAAAPDLLDALQRLSRNPTSAGAQCLAQAVIIKATSD